MNKVEDVLDKEQVEKIAKVTGASTKSSREEIIQSIKRFSEAVVNVWKIVKRELVRFGFYMQENNCEQNVKFYRKKKSQRKNWKKWKKRL